MKLCEKTTVFLVFIILFGFFFLYSGVPNIWNSTALPKEYTRKESFDTPPINPPKENEKTLRLMNEAFEETPPPPPPSPPAPSPPPPAPTPPPTPPPSGPPPPGPSHPPFFGGGSPPHSIHPKPWHHAYTPWFWQPRYFHERPFYHDPVERIYITERVPTETKVNSNLFLGTLLLGFATLLAFRL